MNLTTLRVEGNANALELIKAKLCLALDAQWHKGDILRNGTAHEFSGFSTTIADTETPQELIAFIGNFLAQCKENNIQFQALNLSAVLSVGFMVGNSVQFIACVEFSPAELLAFTECGISLSITAYPTSEEAGTE
jgi:hypothetical protein